jgi:signal transduction histidine kinase
MRLQRLLAVVIGVVVVFAIQESPGPGVHGRHLVVSLALVGIVVGAAGVARLSGDREAVLIGTMLLLIASAAVLVGVQPSGPGTLAVFPAVTAAALRLPVRVGRIVTVVAMLALAVGWWLSGDRPVAGIALNELGVVAFYLVALFARRSREANEQTQRLLVELEASRAAQAEAAVLAERQRLAREMHDVLAHTLSGLVLTLESARLLAARTEVDGGVRDSVERAHRLAKSGLDEARRAVGMLRGDELPGPGRLADLALAFEADTGVPCRFELRGIVHDVGADGQLTLYRVAQEALTNVRKHAHAEHVDVVLDFQPAGTRLTVEDVEDSQGGEPLESAAGLVPAGGGYGLTGMRERAELLGGSLAAGPTDAGFRVELWIPQ